MIDLLYILGTVAFFAAMLAYTRGCERLAGDDAAEDPEIMSAETVIAGILGILLLVYLVYTLLRPEKF